MKISPSRAKKRGFSFYNAGRFGFGAYDVRTNPYLKMLIREENKLFQNFFPILNNFSHIGKNSIKPQ